MTIKKSIINETDIGVLSENMQSLHEMLPFLRAVFNHSDDRVIVTDCFDQIVYLNDKQLRLLGLSVEQVVGKACSDVFEDSRSTKGHCDFAQKSIVTKKSITNTRLIDVVKARYDITTTTPILKADRTVIGAISIVKQTTIEKSLAEQEIRRSGVYQKALMDSIPFMMWLKDKKSVILAANNAYAEMAGVSDPKALEGKTDYDLWPKTLATSYTEDDLKVLESGEPVTLAEKVKKKNGDASWVETYKAPVIVDGNVIGTVGYARDISEEKQLLSTISKKDLQFTSLLKNLPLSIVRYDTNCKRIFVNAAHGDDAEQLLGTTPEEMWSSSVQNMTAKQFQEKLMHVLFHGETQTFEMQCMVDDKSFVNMVTLLPEMDEHHQVVGAFAIANDVTEISKYRDDLAHMAYHDTLTTLPNRAFLNQELHKAASKGGRFGLLFMDLDFFKSINDTLGHVVGDELLVDAAKRIVSSVRSDDVVARIGGDEFAILVSDLKNDADLAGLAEKIAESLSQPFMIDEINFFVTASIGISSYPTDSEDVEDLIKYADTAMYDAKKRGRNNYQFYTPELTQDAMEHLAIATALRYAIQKNELYLLYQPKVEIATGKIIGAETLLRWRGNVLGQIEPDKFIPIAEESGLIIEMGAWVLATACEVAAQLNKNRSEPLNIAVNVSSKEFVCSEFISNLQACLTKTGCQPEWLTIEITESLLINDTDKALQTLLKIDEMGITLSIDDFGTGYSALAYLSKFPIRQVKIDRSFVMDICDTERAASLVKAIIAMTLSLNKDLVAEGIETKDQAALLEEYGCHQAQGYLYSKPIPLQEFLHMEAQQKIQ